MAQSPVPISVTISGPTPWIDVKAYGANGDGVTNDHDAIQNAINACPNNGCTIYFGSSNTYLISSGLTIPASKPGIKLLGECGAPGRNADNPPEKCSHIVSSSSIVMLTVGDPVGHTKFHSGLVVQDLGFQDISTNNNVVTGAMRLVQTEDFNLTDVHCRDIKGPSDNGYCFLFDGDTDFTQFGVIINPSVLGVPFPIQTASKVSEINIYGGNLFCSNATTAIGMDLGKTNHTSGISTGGEWGVFGTHFLNCATGISMFNNANMNYYGIMEQTGDGPTGDGIVIDGNLTGKPAKSIIAGSINNFSRGVLLLSAMATNTRILANISSTSTPIVTTSDSLPSTLILTPVNYGAGSGGTPTGSQIPTDITIQGEAKPLAPFTGSNNSARRLYVDSSAGNSSDLTVEKPDGTVVDLEGGLLNYQKPVATGVSGTNQTVYTFSVRSIPAGKGIRARVFWQCLITCAQPKTFSWQFGTVTTAYAAYTNTSMALAYTEVRIFNDVGFQNQDTMFGDAITLATTTVSAGRISTPNQDTSTAKSLTFLYTGTDTITPKGFIVEAIQ